MARVVSGIQHDNTLTSNTLVRKWLAKLMYRLSISYLPYRLHTRVKGLRIESTSQSQSHPNLIGRIIATDRSAGSARTVVDSDDQIEVPPEVEEGIEEIFKLLEDRVSGIC